MILIIDSFIRDRRCDGLNLHLFEPLPVRRSLEYLRYTVRVQFFESEEAAKTANAAAPVATPKRHGWPWPNLLRG